MKSRPLFGSRSRRSESTRRSRWFGQSVALLALASFPFMAPSGKAANTANIFTSGTSLTVPTAWSLGTVPTVANDAVIGGFPSAATTLTISGTNALTFGSLNVLDPFAITINNGTAATVSSLTLGGTGNTGNAYSGTAADLLFVGAGGNLTFANGAGTLNLLLGQSGNFDVVGTAAISSVIGDGGSAYSITKTGGGTLTLSGANTFSGGLNLNAGTVSIAAVNNLGAGTVSFGGGTLAITAAVDPSIQFSQAINQAYSINNSAAVTFATALTSAGGTLTKLGGSVLTSTAANTYSGATTINAGSLALSGANGSLASTAITLQGGGLTLMNTGAGGNNTNRIADAANVTLSGGAFVIGGSDQAGTNASETVGTLTAGTGSGSTPIVTVTPGTAGSTALTAGSYSRAAGSLEVLANGAGLGSSATSTSLLFLTTAPTLVGAGTPAATGNPGAGVQTNTGIVLGMVGESSTTTATGVGTVTGNANTFLTYTATGGLRPLNPTDEFVQNAITAGANNRTTAATGMATNTAVNSLVIGGATAAANTLTLTAGTTLTDTSGMLLFAPSANVASTITGGTVAFGANEGIIYAGGTTGTAQVIASAVTGSNGLTVAGPGTVTISGVLTLSGGTLSLTQHFLTLSNNSNNLAGAAVSATANGGILFLANYNAISGASGLSVSNGSQLRVNATVAAYNTPTSFANVPTTLSNGGNIYFNSPSNNNSYIYPSAVTLGSNGLATIQSYNAGNNYVQLSGGVSSTAGLTSAGVNYMTDGSSASNQHLIYITGTQNYTGPTQFTAGNAIGRVVLGSALPTATVIQTSGTTAARTQQVDLYGLNQTVAGLQSLNTTAVNQIINSNATLATLTVNNTNNYVFGGNLGTVGAVSTGGAAPTGTIFTGQGNTIAAGLANNLGLTKSGSGMLTLAGANSLTGPTSITGGTLILVAPAVSATTNTGLNTSPSVTLSGTGALTLNSLVALSDTGTLSLATGTTLNLNATTGSETVGTLILNGIVENPGIYTAAQLTALDGTINFSSLTGETLTVAVPEPGTYLGGLLLLGALGYRTRKQFSQRSA